jgi:hypothetical protein
VAAEPAQLGAQPEQATVQVWELIKFFYRI